MGSALRGRLAAVLLHHVGGHDQFQIVFGYPGVVEVDLAMERGEVEGRGTNPYSDYMSGKPEWMPKKLIRPLIQVGMVKEPALPDVASAIDTRSSLSDNCLQRLRKRLYRGTLLAFKSCTSTKMGGSRLKVGGVKKG